ncbi:gelsolin-like protein 1 [Porites lutea]|uniref:gelsolin-like protein 1 n=1 Tax=Porites lutea TaxID=51062 RepID=UPI003CC5A0DA
MSGLVKQKEYDWKHSNIANIGSNQDILARKNAALSEPAWSETTKMQENGPKIWRIEKFEVKEWPEEKYGTFFSGDSYIILHTEKASPDSDVIFYDVHFWIGKHSTQDEYTTAAYKTVELDAYLDDKAVQHREVESFESEAFKEYFVALGGIKIAEGG